MKGPIGLQVLLGRLFRPSHTRCDRRRLCLHAGSFYHPSLAASFRFLDELGHPPGVRGRRVEREPKILNSRSSNSESVISAQTSFQQPSSIMALVSRTRALAAPG
jgi:hypothetical protein